MAYKGIGEKRAGIGVVDDLMNIHRDAPVVVLVKTLGVDSAGDGGELSRPVGANRRSAPDATAFPGVGPVDVGMHELNRGLDVASIECAIGRPHERFPIRHAQARYAAARRGRRFRFGRNPALSFRRRQLALSASLLQYLASQSLPAQLPTLFDSLLRFLPTRDRRLHSVPSGPTATAST